MNFKQDAAAAAAGTDGRSRQSNETQEGYMSASRGRGRPPTSTNPRNVSRRKENRHLRRKVFIIISSIDLSLH